MNHLFKHLLLATLAFVATAPALAQERGSANDATALIKKVIAQYKANGKEKTFAAINEQNPKFKYKDLYVFGSTA